MPLEISISGASGVDEVIETVQLNQEQIKIAIPYQAVPEQVVLDPRTILLAEWALSQKE